ncbi:MAG TPA: polysaccharide biosynthesis/export family protein [Rhizomicrobium sp.]|jgi:polysaccharide export outer membrane protein|nr:polysaccharide biosynthesis/export family protein [Rhizomicrobium sp.]
MKAVRIKSLVRVLAAAGAIALVCLAVSTAARAHAPYDPEAAALAMPTESDDYRLGSGDQLRVIVYGEDDLGGTFNVDGNGFVSFPLIGPMKVAGLETHDVEQEMTARLGDGYLINPRVNVQVLQYRPFYVLGEVNKPGSYPYTSNMTVLNAITDAGGYTQKAVESSVYVRRNGETKEEELPADPSTKIYPGDVVRVDSSTFWDALSVLGPLAGFAALGAALHN